MELEARLLRAFIASHPTEAARALESTPTQDAAAVLADLTSETAIELLEWMSPLSAAHALDMVDVELAARIISEGRRDVAAAILRAMRAQGRAEIMRSMPSEVRRSVERLLRYSEGTAGALMDPTVLAITETASVAQALERFRQVPHHGVYYLYVVSERHRLVGVMNIRELLAARPEQLAGLIALRDVESLSARASWESVIAHPAWNRFHALPVVEADGRFVGVVRYESIRQLQSRFTETRPPDQGARTGVALGELYGLGLRGLFAWAASAMQDPERGQP